MGDLLSYWTGGLLKSTVHRVTFPNTEKDGEGAEDEGKVEDRYSIAYFCHPCRDTELVPVPSDMVRERAGAVNGGGQGGKESGRALTAAEHLNGRLAATYGRAMGIETDKA